MIIKNKRSFEKMERMIWHVIFNFGPFFKVLQAVDHKNLDEIGVNNKAQYLMPKFFNGKSGDDLNYI